VKRCSCARGSHAKYFRRRSCLGDVKRIDAWSSDSGCWFLIRRFDRATDLHEQGPVLRGLVIAETEL